MHRSGTRKRAGAKLRAALGFTMAELLIVVAIIAIVSGVAFISFARYQRSIGRLERDSIAKQIFVAAQNHLTLSKGEGYLGTDDYGTLGDYVEGTVEDADRHVYYIVVHKATVQGNKGKEALERMLPFGSIDETVRGGSYLIRYQPETATVLDVFYWTTNATPATFNLAVANVDYKNFMDVREDKSARETYTDGSILGWYGGTDPSELPSITLKAPTVTVRNAEKLTVTVKDVMQDPAISAQYAGTYSLKLIITGQLSGAKKGVLLLKSANSTENVSTDGRLSVSGDSYTFVLDEITREGRHFAEMGTDNGVAFLPGENLKIEAVAYSTEYLANLAYSAEKITNSLFADGSTESTAYIGNIRHLENLDKTISDLDNADKDLHNALDITAAKQITDLSWTEFATQVGGTKVNIFKNNATIGGADDHYLPVEPTYTLSYDGQGYSVSDVTAEATNAGMFGSSTTMTAIQNLELIDFAITGTDSAGALAGTLTGTEITNVLARNTTGAAAVNISAPGGSAGGLVGSINNGEVNYSAAAVVVSGGTAGGLIGDTGASGTVVYGSYSAGHTAGGAYPGTTYDVTGTLAGGLIGDASASTVSYSYSTCSVSGTTVGGFAGRANGSISHSYATGLLSPAAATKYAFLASGTATLSGNRYFATINMVQKEGGKEGETTPMKPAVSSTMAQLEPLDLNTTTYNSFVGPWPDWNEAKPYDNVLKNYYTGRYTLRTVDELNAPLPEDYDDWSDLFVFTHYGDWPSPEVLFINK